ncbi:hypothetical protein ACH4C2_30425 [Streptomyces sp. NPDC018057]|uniref:hypothetical protein n=1 Tax=unclassified Streptomyces TaxID=2593676 RepID=UPI0037A1E648
MRGDLLAALTGMGEARAAFFAVAAATAFSGLLAHTGLSPAQVRDRILGGQPLARSRTIYQRAHDRGEIAPAASLPPYSPCRSTWCATTSSWTSNPSSPPRIRSIVDELVLPLVLTERNRRARRPGRIGEAGSDAAGDVGP